MRYILAVIRSCWHDGVEALGAWTQIGAKWVKLSASRNSILLLLQYKHLMGTGMRIHTLVLLEHPLRCVLQRSASAPEC
jgi:hypothetical protein